MATQCAVAFNCRLLSVVFPKGHNNDQDLFKMTLRKVIEKDNVVGLGDRRYTHPLVISPDDVEPALQVVQASERAIVEKVFPRVNKWKFACGKVRQIPEPQSICLKII